MKVFLLALILALTFTLITAEEGFVRSMEFSLLKKRDISSKMTFYEDDQLNNAACYGRDGIRSYNAKPSDRIGAVSNNNMCYQCIKITNPKNRKSVIVKIVDECEGCAKNNIDVTRSAFSSIANLDDGIVKITWKGVACPSKGRFPTFEKNKKKN
jgi:expansin (peptidoglycan-binding protein)